VHVPDGSGAGSLVQWLQVVTAGTAAESQRRTSESLQPLNSTEPMGLGQINLFDRATPKGQRHCVGTRLALIGFLTFLTSAVRDVRRKRMAGPRSEA
jgi:hypothetical protein